MAAGTADPPGARRRRRGRRRLRPRRQGAGRRGLADDGSSVRFRDLAAYDARPRRRPDQVHPGRDLLVCSPRGSPCGSAADCPSNWPRHSTGTIPAYPPAPPPGSVKPCGSRWTPASWDASLRGTLVRYGGWGCRSTAAWPSRRATTRPSARGTHRPGRSCVAFRGHTDQVFGAAVSADGRRLLSGGKDGTVRLWDVESGEERRRLDGAGWVTSVAFSRDGSQALIGRIDGLTRLWDVDNWKELRPFSFRPPRCGAWPFLLTIAALAARGPEQPCHPAALGPEGR